MENKDIRKLVSIKRIDKLKEIEGADLIELAIIGGWQSVVMKGQLNLMKKLFTLRLIHSCLIQ